MNLDCDISLVNSGSTENGTLHPTYSQCNYYYKFSYNKTKQTILKSNHCTNKPVSCNQCKGIFWSYNLLEHYKLTFQVINCQQMVSEEEKN